MAFILLFLLFFFFLLFLFAFYFLFHLEDYIGLHSRVTQTYYRLSTDITLALHSEKRYIASQSIGTIWCALCVIS